MLSELRLERRYADGIHVEWSPKTLHQLLDQELPGAQVIVVSNRNPISTTSRRRHGGANPRERPGLRAGAGYARLRRHLDRPWLRLRGSRDRRRKDRIAVPPDAPSYALRRVWISEEEQDGYYYGLANEGFGPCAISPSSGRSSVNGTGRTTWPSTAVRRRRPQGGRPDDPIVLVQDYHFALLPRMLRERLPRRRSSPSGIFLGPTPKPSAFAPGRSDPRRPPRKHHPRVPHPIPLQQLHRDRRPVHRKPYRPRTSHRDPERARDLGAPLSDLDRLAGDKALENQPSVEGLSAQRPLPNWGLLPDDALLAVGIERFDYTKGVIDRMRAIDLLLENHPEWRGRLSFRAGGGADA